MILKRPNIIRFVEELSNTKSVKYNVYILIQVTE